MFKKLLRILSIVSVISGTMGLPIARGADFAEHSKMGEWRRRDLDLVHAKAAAFEEFDRLTTGCRTLDAYSEAEQRLTPKLLGALLEKSRILKREIVGAIGEPEWGLPMSTRFLETGFEAARCRWSMVGHPDAQRENRARLKSTEETIAANAWDGYARQLAEKRAARDAEKALQERRAAAAAAADAQEKAMQGRWAAAYRALEKNKPFLEAARNYDDAFVRLFVRTAEQQICGAGFDMSQPRDQRISILLSRADLLDSALLIVREAAEEDPIIQSLPLPIKRKVRTESLWQRFIGTDKLVACNRMLTNTAVIQAQLKQTYRQKIEELG